MLWAKQFWYYISWCHNLLYEMSKMLRLYLIHFGSNDTSLNHRCTRVENPGEGVRDVFAQIPRGGVKGFRKNCQGGSTYFAFYCIFINKFFENLPGGVLFHTPPSPLPPPLCASMLWILSCFKKRHFKQKN